MQFSHLERETFNSPLKCSTNNEASPDKHSAKLQDQAYRSSGEKNAAQVRASPSPTKPSGSRLTNSFSPSPEKTTSSLYGHGENA